MSGESGSAEQKQLAPGLYLVATPIGNLEDITLRALRVLRSADRIACEDTRQTRKLLNHFDISTPVLSLHEHNEASRAAGLIPDLLAGARIAVVSDAGMPGISDPGTLLVKAAIEAGVSVVPVPGANAALSALIASGLNTDEFLFLGFLTPKTSARRARMHAIHAGLTGPLTLVLYEAPHRILEALADVESVYGPECRVVLARELTKIHEEFLRGTVREVRAQLAERDRMRGEMVLLMEARPLAAEETTTASSLRQRVDDLANSEDLSEMDALKRIAKERGISKSELYRELQRERGRKRI